MNVLVSSAGRRGALVRLIRETVQPLGGQVFAVDSADWSSACRLADDWRIVPPFEHEQFFDCVANFCQQRGVQLIIPTHDRELPVYARLHPLFAELGIHVACSGPETVAIAADKSRTDEFLRECHLPTVTRIPLVLADDPQMALPFPLVVKPRHGSCSAGVHVAHDSEELAFYLKRTLAPIVQRQATGSEYTTNVLVGRDGRCLAAVPHWRVETRGGEVSKCVTVRHPQLLQLAERLVKSLPDPFGPLCFQSFVSEQDDVQIIEINARFGGGYPVAHQAGANFIRMVIDELIGKPVTPPDWTEGLAMTRWDDAVFWNARDELQCA
jgi:carbamoyl-phosphate synthase large subunit